MNTSSKKVALVLTAVLCAACGQDADQAPAQLAPPAPATAAQPPTPSPSAPDPASVGANELGQVPVLMYHRLTDQPTSVYDRTPAAFRAELERLAAEGYVSVTTTEYATGRIDIPAGKHPVVLTFDDGDPTQFALGPDGRPVPGTAVATLLDVAARNPGFRPVASLYVNAAPFGSPDGGGVLPWLRDHGFEIGNHTQTHTNLAGADDTGVQEAIALGQREIQRAVPDLVVTSLALPFGAAPANAALAARGAFDGASYDHACVLLVGSNPAPSPFAPDFNPLATPRIRSQDATGQEAEYGSTAWLDKLAATPTARYTSDGDPSRISHPAAAGPPADHHAARSHPY
ncbi:polysaccharide deacetylase family protein [Saccharothrix yanglingensis]|uniref:Xylanase n=1 Tax=Saccharothrix yanglingensis TaxID=659496 RepID=A0ABU0X319_9PSEU|nr:polysaccharide deacetylase family protein [Saccharothrix yanglingensis]MDQ2586531.1 xylanase [Saccharothrix yanglingensis]